MIAYKDLLKAFLGITIKKSRVGLGSLRSLPPSEPYVIVSNHTALHFDSNTSDNSFFV